VNFHGGMTRAQKEHVIIQFREGTRVLVSTESGGEGRNLQFCHRMVNFDIPWNPMRIIGRIHRIGQQHEVNIYNLTAQGTMEEHILRILDAKINLFQLVVGELDMILGSLDNQREFEDILMDIWIQAKDEDELIRGVDALGDELLAAKTHYQKVREVDDRLLSEFKNCLAKCMIMQEHIEGTRIKSFSSSMVKTIRKSPTHSLSRNSATFNRLTCRF